MKGGKNNHTDTIMSDYESKKHRKADQLHMPSKVTVHGQCKSVAVSQLNQIGLRQLVHFPKSGYM